MTRRTALQRYAINSAGILGYFSLVMQWLWIGVVFLPGLLENDSFRSVFAPRIAKEQPDAAAIEGAISSPLLIAVSVVITLVMIAVTIYVLYKLPSTIAKTGSKITKEASSVVIPVMTHHKKISPAKKQRLTFSVTFAIKFFAALIPLPFLFLQPGGDYALDQELIQIIGVFFTASALAWFGVQFALAKLFRVGTKNVL